MRLRSDGVLSVMYRTSYKDVDHRDNDQVLLRIDDLGLDTSIGIYPHQRT